jgi:hypothetical protein
MHRGHAGPMYTGIAPVGLADHRHRGHGGSGFCSGCGHPRAACCCSCRECRRESRDLLVQPTSTRAKLADDPALADSVRRMSMLSAFSSLSSKASEQAEATPEANVSAVGIVRNAAMGLGSAFIGGGCCVHLSVEYTPTSTANGLVAILVQDSNDTTLAWMKQVIAGRGYQIKEGVVTTKPGAQLTVLVVGATARVRWCEVFSCC